MAILRILFRRRSSCQLRMMAGANIFACAFVTMMTLLTSFTGFFIYVPAIFKDNEQSVFCHRFFIGYLFVNVCGNFILCVRIDTSTARPYRKTDRQTENVDPSKKASRKSVVLDKRSCTTSQTHPVSVDEKSNDTTGSRQQDSSSSLHSGTSSSNSSEYQNSLNNSEISSDSPVPGVHSKTNAIVEGDKTNDESEGKSYLSSTSEPSTCHIPVSDTAKENSNTLSTKTDSKPSRSADVRGSARTKAPNSSSRKKQQEAVTADSPERSHDCKLCEKRILRRDHHCFFMTVCIGYHNHKHFIFFCLYMMTGALYGVILSVRYLYLFYNIRFRGPQTFVFLLLQVLYNVLIKRLVTSPFFLLIIFQLYVCLMVGLVAAGFLYWHMAITVHGQTTHEASLGDVRYRRRLTHNLRDVFGRFWPLLFLLPLPLPQAGDGRRYTAAPVAVDAQGKRRGKVSDQDVGTKNDNHHDVDAAKGENPGSSCPDEVRGQSSHSEHAGKREVRRRGKLGKGRLRKT